jgi:hypothetical protein
LPRRSSTATFHRRSDGGGVISEIIGLDKKEFLPLWVNPAIRVGTPTFSNNAPGF